MRCNLRSVFTRTPAITLAITLMVSASYAVTAHDEPSYDHISLQVTEVDEVANDLLIAVLFSEHEGSDAAQTADMVNRDVAWALQLVTAQPAVKSQTLDYRTNPVFRNQNITGWRTRQSMRLETHDSAVLSGLIGQLQVRLGVASLGHDVSRAKRASLEEGLVARALEAFAKRAGLIATTLGRSGYRLVRIDVATAGQQPQPHMQLRAMALMETAVAAPTIAAGEQTIEVTVSGTIELRP